MQADHESLVALLPVESHGLMTLAECFDFILLHVRDNLKVDRRTCFIKCVSNMLQNSQRLLSSITYVFVEVDAPLR